VRTTPTAIRCALAAGLLAVAAEGVLAVAGGTGSGPGAVLYTAIELLAVGLLTLRAATVGRDRFAWSLLAGSVALWTAGDLTWTVWLDNVASPPVPSVADGLYYASYLPLYAGMALLIRTGRSRVDAGLWLDALVAAFAISALAITIFVAPMLRMTDGSAWRVAATLGYPLADTALVGLVLVGFGLSGWRPGRAWVILGSAQVLSALADTLYCYQQATGSYRPEALLDAAWPLALLTMAVAAWHRPDAERAVADPEWRAVLVPGAFGGLALSLLVVGQWKPVSPLATAFATTAMLLAGARAALTFAENRRLYAASRREAREDALSGLPNRRALLLDLHAALDAPAPAPRILAFFDLDGFKRYNDGFGHAAGDALLRRLGERLRDVVAPYGKAYRLGGDEFCVLTDDVAFDPEWLQQRASLALSERGEGFDVAPSTGAVALPAEATTPTEALRLADERMYAEKGIRAGSSRRQTRDVLLALVDEREPALGEHNHDVTRLCEAVATRLGLTAVEVDVVLRAAELHDVGKAAIPDRILHKPGPLDASEWALMREHTVIGARILNVAAALRPVATLVRASHERFDGGGYPDGLAGAAIPMGARIIAVCDSYDAMVSDRPYRRGMSSELALEELRRCAGAQFDPDVVAAFIAAMDDRAQPAHSASSLST
jgi:diguanylate cyclase (GGDEF)-like protein